MMLAVTGLAVKFLLPAEVVALLAALTDPEWAVPLNTLLLIILTIIAAHNGVRAKRVGDNVEAARQEVTKKVDYAADAAASAAEAAAAAARIAKEAGGVLRDSKEVHITPENHH